MQLRAITTATLISFAALAAPATIGRAEAAAHPALEPGSAVTTAPPGTTPPSTFNVFLPEDRGLEDCLNNSVERPGCGSEARGGWRQYLILVALLVGLGFIGWRIVAGVRRGRRDLERPGGPPDRDDADRNGPSTPQPLDR